jgi:SAM-dependent methyltransferase
MPDHELRDSQHYAQVAHAFDRAAQNYDTLYQANPIMAWLRRESLAVLQATFPRDGRILEIGCGTGDEALAMSCAGYRIVATDISPAMIEAARAKPTPNGGDVTWHVLPAGQLACLVDEYGHDSFDGAYASFGVLNCELDLAPVVAILAELLRTGAALVCSVMNRWCAWEIGWGLLHLRPRQAFRRLGREPLAAGLASPDGRLSVPARYYNPRSFARLLAPSFRVQLMRGFPILLPPPYLAHLFDRHPALFARLDRIERRWRDRFPLHSLGDHFLAVLERC